MRLLAFALALCFPALSWAYQPVPGVPANGDASQYLNGLRQYAVPSGAGSTGNIVGSGVTVPGHPGCWNAVNATSLIDCVFPTVTISTSTATTITGILKGTGSLIAAAVAGTDYVAPTGSGAALTGITWSQIGSTPTTLAGYGITSPLPVAQGGTGITSLGTGVAAAMGSATNGASGFPVLNGSGLIPNSEMQGNIGTEIPFFYNGTPSASAILATVFSRQTVVAASAPIKCSAISGATSSATVTLAKVTGGSPANIGTLVFASSGSAYETCTVTFTGSVTFAAGDMLTLTFPGTPDATLANVAITLPALQ